MARKFVDRAVALAGGVSPGEKLSIQLARAEVPGDTAGVETSLDALVNLHPDDKWVQLRFAIKLQNQGDLAGAVKTLEKSTALDPGFAAAYCQTGDARMASGDLPGAEKARERRGDAAGARRAFTELARWNQDGLDFAMVRARVLAKAGAAQ